jgi:spore coat protein U-like protein
MTDLLAYFTGIPLAQRNGLGFWLEQAQGDTATKNLFRLFLTSVFCLTGTPASPAGTDTAILHLRANVIEGARIENVSEITHIDYDPTDPTTPNDATGALTVRATKGMSYKVYIGNDRTMTNGSDTLNYEIYSDPGYTAAWGSSFGTGESYTSTSNAPSTKTLYSRIPAMQAVPAGTYTDTVMLTLEW